jgi:hypothetical protein
VLVLHIGFHKTGSTTLQTALAGSAGALAAADVVYPSQGLERRVAHHHIATAIQSRAPLPEIDGIAGLAATGTVVLSSERFGLCDPAQVRERLGPARIVCYRRDMPSSAVSRYRQVTRRGASLLSFDQVFATGRLTVPSEPVLAGWAGVFGTDAVRIRSLDPACLDGGDLLADFGGLIGARLAATGPQNVSPGWRAVECLRAFAIGLEDPGFVGRHLRQAVEAAAEATSLNEPGLYLSADQIASLEDAEGRDRSGLTALGLDAALAPARPIQPRAFQPTPEAIERDKLAMLLRETRRRLDGRYAAAM